MSFRTITVQWNGNVIILTKFSSLAALEVEQKCHHSEVTFINGCAGNSQNVVILIKFSFLAVMVGFHLSVHHRVHWKQRIINLTTLSSLVACHQWWQSCQIDRVVTLATLSGNTPYWIDISLDISLYHAMLIWYCIFVLCFLTQISRYDTSKMYMKSTLVQWLFN